MSKLPSKKRTSMELCQVLQESDKNKVEANPISGTSENLIQRKGGLKPQDDRMFSEKRLAENENKGGTLKSIKSNKSIQFKNSNQFERFTYVKDNGSPSVINTSNQSDGQCCQIM